MKPFAHVYASDFDEAVRLLSASAGKAAVIAGGSDLLAMMKDRLTEPDVVINLQSIPNATSIQFGETGDVKIGGMTTLRKLEQHPTLLERYPVLAKAAGAVASPPIRNVATVGGNLSQRTRCWYYRGPFKCWLKGGEECFAVKGENRFHAIFGEGPCYMVHASDLGAALCALNGRIAILGPQGPREVPAEQFFVNPTDVHRCENNLRPGEIVTQIVVPAMPSGARSGFVKVMQRAAWDAAIVSIAYVLGISDSTCHSASIVLGGVATTPVRAHAVERELLGNRLSSEVISKAVRAVSIGAQPLSQNGFKLPLLEGCMEGILGELC